MIKNEILTFYAMHTQLSVSGLWRLATMLSCHGEGGSTSLAGPHFCESEFGSICLLTVVYNSMNPWLAQEIDVK